MPRYVRKEQTFDAVQVHVDGRIIVGEALDECDPEELHFEPGDWVLFEDGAPVEVVDDDDFHEMFEPEGVRPRHLQSFISSPFGPFRGCC